MSARRFSKKNRRKRYKACDDVVRVTGLEPAREIPLEPKSNVFANFTIPAGILFSVRLEEERPAAPVGRIARRENAEEGAEESAR